VSDAVDRNDAPILVCACGKRLRAPGARPGRVGRCPACGDVLRVEDATSVSAPEEVSCTPDGPPKRRRRKRPEAQTKNWNGFVSEPARRESRVRESFLYPLWGVPGISLLVFLPPVLWFASIPVSYAVLALFSPSGFTRNSLNALLIMIPSTFFLGLLLGYVLLFLGRVVASSASGQVHHPHPPDWDLSDILFGLGRWVWAGLVGVVVGGLPATAYWVYCGDIDLFDAMILAELLAVGAIYALMALLASILYEDILAANPFTVIRAIVRVGWSYAWPCLLTGFAVLTVLTLAVASFKVQSPAGAAFLLWFFWVVALYLSMVVLRVLGLFYHAHSRELGWFRDRTGWGV
jgi:hypothetical protein